MTGELQEVLRERAMALAVVAMGEHELAYRRHGEALSVQARAAAPLQQASLALAGVLASLKAAEPAPPVVCARDLVRWALHSAPDLQRAWAEDPIYAAAAEAAFGRAEPAQLAPVVADAALRQVGKSRGRLSLSRVPPQEKAYQLLRDAWVTWERVTYEDSIYHGDDCRRAQSVLEAAAFLLTGRTLS